MPKQKRWAIKRQLDEANEDIVRAQAHLVGVYVEFADIHPQQAEYLESFGRGLAEVAKCIERFKDEEV